MKMFTDLLDLTIYEKLNNVMLPKMDVVFMNPGNALNRSTEIIHSLSNIINLPSKIFYSCP